MKMEIDITKKKFGCNMKIEVDIPKELINEICQLFMEHECIEQYSPDAIDWIYEQINNEQQ